MTRTKEQLRANMIWEWLADRRDSSYTIDQIARGVGLDDREAGVLIAMLVDDGCVVESDVGGVYQIATRPSCGPGIAGGPLGGW
jgi:predicted transcriptional regulator